MCKVLGEDLDEDEVISEAGAPNPNPNPNPNRNPDPNPNPNQVNDMVSEAISNFKGEIYYDGFVKILLAN